MINSSLESSLHQVALMEQFSHVQISLQAKKRYVELRQESFAYDQRLLAQVIAQEDPSSLHDFWSAYPNIFRAELNLIAR